MRLQIILLASNVVHALLIPHLVVLLTPSLGSTEFSSTSQPLASLLSKPVLVEQLTSLAFIVTLLAYLEQMPEIANGPKELKTLGKKHPRDCGRKITMESLKLPHLIQMLMMLFHTLNSSTKLKQLI